MKRLYFAYVNPPVMTGQKLASLLIMRHMRSVGMDVVPKPFPVMDWGAWRPWALVVYALRLGWAWLVWLPALLAREVCVHLNAGQSKISLLRDAPVVLLLKTLRPKAHIVLSLHGSWFMRWGRDSFEAQLFLRMVRASAAVTVLGEQQRLALIALGAPPEKVIHVDNACEVTPLTPEAVRQKHAEGCEPLRLLFLSNLVDDKGFAEYVDMVLTLAQRVGKTVPIDAVLCGDILPSGLGFHRRFANEQQARAWIESRIASLEQMDCAVRLRWITQAQAEQKAALFAQAHVFYLPSRLEGQPMVLLEAMASGCAIVATRVGEVPSTVGSAACLIDEPSVEALVQASLPLMADAQARTRMGLDGLANFAQRFTLARYGATWERLLLLEQGQK